MLLRRIKRRLNTIVRRCGFAPLFLSACNVPPPDQPTDATASTTISTTGDPLPERCAAACAKFEADGCVQAEKVCAKDGFDDAGECARWVLCEDACQETPDFYLDQECELP